MSDKFLTIYLNDHLAGAIGGSELAKRTAQNNEGTEFGPRLEKLASDIEEDRQSLESLMERLGIKKDLLKDAAAWMAEKVGRLKLNGQLTGYSDLSRLVELEGLTLGVEGKLSLWRNLSEVLAAYPAIEPGELQELQTRSEDQRKELEELRRKAASIALG
ncbi:MAG: hypothetical protein M3285_11325 [Actinomycetota bacterium]|nr:hypothetical protein [Actinomycetota bacterium]